MQIIINIKDESKIDLIISFLKEIPFIEINEQNFVIKEQVDKKELDKEQKELLDLLNYTIDSGRGDFAERHNHYIYEASK